MPKQQFSSWFKKKPWMIWQWHGFYVQPRYFQDSDLNAQIRYHRIPRLSVCPKEDQVAEASSSIALGTIRITKLNSLKTLRSKNTKDYNQGPLGIQFMDCNQCERVAYHDNHRGFTEVTEDNYTAHVQYTKNTARIFNLLLNIALQWRWHLQSQQTLYHNGSVLRVFNRHDVLIVFGNQAVLQSHEYSSREKRWT